MKRKQKKNQRNEPVALSTPAFVEMSRTHHLLALMLLLLLIMVVFWPSIDGSFIIDDIAFIQDNPYLNFSDNLGRYFSQGTWSNTSIELTDAPVYRPLLLVVISVIHGFFGANPAAFHVPGILLHITNTLLIYHIAKQVTPMNTVLPAFAASALFALHPTRVESVAWISDINDPMVTFFLLGSLLAHRRFATTGQWGALGIGLVSFSGAMFSKEVAFGFPLLLLVHDRICYRKIRWGSMLPFSGVALIYLLAREAALPHSSTAQLGLTSVTHFMDYMTGYVGLLLLPLKIPLYLTSPVGQVGHYAWIAALLLLIGGIVTLTKKTSGAVQHAVLVASAWSLIFMWPAVLLSFYGDGFFAARFLYVPAAGISLLFALGLAQVQTAWPKSQPAIVAGCFVMITAFILIDRSEIIAWKNNATISSKMVISNPYGYSGYMGLAKDAMEHEDYPLAKQQYELALTLSPPPATRVAALLSLGTIAGMSQNLTLSEQYFRKALTIAPRSSEGWNGLGNIALINNDAELAVQYYTKSVELNGNNREAVANLENAYAQVRRKEPARR